MKASVNKELARVAIEQNYHVTKYTERRGIPGIITWWSEIKRDEAPGKKHLVIETLEHYDSILLNGIELTPEGK